MAGGSAVSVAVKSDASAERSGSYSGPLGVLTTLFFMWGFVTCLNDSLIPHLKAAFSLGYAQAMMIQFAFFAAYFLMSLPAGRLVSKVGYKAGIIVGLLVAAAGCLCFYPAAGMRSYPLFLSALFILAAGITTLQVAANPYVAILGKPETASTRLTLTQAFNSLGTTLAPQFGALFILGGATEGAAAAGQVQRPYLGLAATLMVMAAAIAFCNLPKIEAASSDDLEGHAAHKSAWRYKHLVLGALGIFLYVGAEVAIGSMLTNYLSEPDIAGLKEAEANRYLSFYWGGSMVGRFIGPVAMKFVRPNLVLAFNAAAAVVLVLATMIFSGPMAMWTILAVGLFNSVMFPTVFALAIEGLGKHTGQGSGILCMAIVGGALVPVAQGALADTIGIHHAFVLPALCYGYIAWYALRGYRSDLPSPS
jgi:FHS family L-fucose permease-like MFS transporter